MKKKTCCFTGHRPQSLPFGFNENDARCDALKKALREQIIYLIEKENVTHFISGMAIGIDMYAGEVVGSSPGAILQHCYSVRQRNNAPNALHAGLYGQA